MTSQSRSSTDHLPSNTQPIPHTSTPPPNPPMPSHPLSRSNTHPTPDLEAAYLPARSSSYELERPPAYMEQDMDEPLPTYMGVAKQKMRQLAQYPAAKMPSRKWRKIVMVFIVVIAVLLIVIPIAATRGNSSDNGDDATN